MAKPAARIIFLEALLLAAGAAIVARSFSLQVIHHETWVAKAGNRRQADQQMPARRGRIYDRNGKTLAVSQEQYRLQIALNQLKDTAALQAKLPRLLGVSRARVDEQFHNDYPYFYGPFGAEQVDSLRRISGVRLIPLYNRVYPVPSLADRVLGRIDDKGTGIEGMEKALDTLLQGHAGVEHIFVDVKAALASGARSAAVGAGRRARRRADDRFRSAGNRGERVAANGGREGGARW